MSKGPRKPQASSRRKLRPKLSNSSREKGWLLEQLVRALEAMLSTTHCTIKTRHRLRDNATGTMREADVYIEERLRGNLIRTVIECRHHRRLVDVTYVEQIISKRADLGSPVFCIVSKTGFTKGALAKAERHGISTFTLDDIKDPSFIEWLTGVNCVELHPQLKLENWEYLTETEAEPHLIEGLEQADCESMIFLDRDGNPGASVRQIVEVTLPQFRDRAVENLDKQGNHLMGVKVLFPGETFVNSTNGLVPVKGIQVNITASWREIAFKLTYSQYRLANSDPVRAKLGLGTLSDGTAIAFTDDPNTGKRLLTIIPPEGGMLPKQLILMGEGTLAAAQSAFDRAALQAELDDELRASQHSPVPDKPNQSN